MLMIFFIAVAMLLLILLITPYISWAQITMSLFMLTILFLIYLPSPHFHIAPLSSHMDLLSLLLVMLTFWITALMLLASQPILLNNKSPSSFLMYVVLLMLVLLCAFYTSNLLSFYVFFEASLIPTLLLILGWGYQPERLQAGTYLIMYTVTASLPLLLSLLFMYKSNFHLSLLLPSWSFYTNSLNLTTLWWLFTILAFMVKTPLYLVHLWLPKAHVEAPVAGSMILAGILLKLGTYGLLRVASKMAPINKMLSPAMITVCTVGGAITSFICIRQTDVKSLIAYSSVSHMGLATAGVMTGTTWGWQGGLSMLLAHGLCSSCMFSLANMSYETTQSRSMYVTKGLLALFPSMTFWWFCLAACNMAAPPSMNLASEILLITSTLSFSTISSIPLAIMTFMAAAYSLILYTATQHGTPSKFQHPLNLFISRNYTICLAHLIPLITLITKMDFISYWT
uniref:NADH-ubiquinone oxidoreductase chain 4 n=1 Tax=Prionospio sp. 4 MH-2023 TaxID=3059272 RepID=A0AAU6QGH7_9ANNE